MRLALIAAILLAGCSDQENGNSDAIGLAPPAYPAADAMAAAGDAESESAPPPVIRPSHYYEERRGDTYYYVAAVSEEDRKRGIAIGNVSAFQYLGQNDAGEHILASMNDDGSMAYRAKCAVSCRIIDTDSGRKIAYSPTSIIGSAFDDAFSGRLRIAEQKRDQLPPGYVLDPPVMPSASPVPQPSAIPLPPQLTGQEPVPIGSPSLAPAPAEPIAQGSENSSPALAN